MNIAIIGTGQVGGRLAKAWAAKGHNIFLGTRNAHSVTVGDLTAAYPENISAYTAGEAAQKGEVIVIAVPAANVREVALQLTDIGGRILVDTTNSVFGTREPYESTCAVIAEVTGNDRVVKCFNSTGASNLDNPHYGAEKADILLCGEYTEDKEIISRLATDLGLNVYDIGGIDQERITEYAALVWASLAFGAGLGRTSALKALVR